MLSCSTQLILGSPEAKASIVASQRCAQQLGASCAIVVFGLVFTTLGPVRNIIRCITRSFLPATTRCCCTGLVPNNLGRHNLHPCTLVAQYLRTLAAATTGATTRCYGLCVGATGHCCGWRLPVSSLTHSATWLLVGEG